MNIRNAMKGKVYVVGDDIDTDSIIPARYMTSADPSHLGSHAMEDLDPVKYPTPFLGKNGLSEYDIIVAGRNFGCGSSREHAPIALNAAGVRAVIAKSFARIFYRNSVNGGIILPIETADDISGSLATGDVIEIYMETSKLRDGKGNSYSFLPFGKVKDIIDAGGLTEYNRKRLGIR